MKITPESVNKKRKRNDMFCFNKVHSQLLDKYVSCNTYYFFISFFVTYIGLNLNILVVPLSSLVLPFAGNELTRYL